MIEIFFYTLSSVIIMFLLGSGLTLIAIPKQLQKYALWLSPWYFIFFIIITLTAFSLLGFSVTDIGPFIILFLIGLLIYVWKKTSIRFQFSLKQDVLLLFFIVMSITLNFSPLIRRHGLLTTVSMGNNDVIVYAEASEFLVNYSLLENFYLKTLPGVSGLLDSGYRWGTPILESFFLYAFNFLGYQFTYPLQVILYALSIPLAYILLQLLFRKSTTALIILSLLFTFNPNLLYMIYHVFFGQVLFWGISLSILIVLFSYFSYLAKSKKSSLLYEVTLGVAIVVFYLSYHEPAIFMFGPLLLYLLYIFVRKKNFLIYLQSIMKIGFIAILLGSVSIINAIVIDFIQTFGSDPNAKIGWELFRRNIPYANSFEMMGFWSIHSFEPLPLPFAMMLSLLVIIILIYGFIESKNKVLLFAYMIIFVFFVILMGPINKNFFAYNRAVTYTLPLFLIVFTIGLTKLTEKGKFLKLIIFSSLLLIIFSGLKLNRRFLREHLAVDKSYISLKELPKEINEALYTEAFVSPTLSTWRNNWISYFVYPQVNNSIFPTKFIDNKYTLKVPSGALILIEKPVPWYQPTNIIFTKKVWENEFYTLGRICNKSECLLESKKELSSISFNREDFQDSLLINGWSIKEDGHRWAASKEATARLVAGEDEVTRLVLEALPLDKNQSVTVFVNEKFVGKKQLSSEWEEYTFELLEPVQNEVLHIEFVFDKVYNPAQMGISQDTRDLTANFKRIELQ